MEMCVFARIMGAFTMDVIASTAFGLDIDSQNDPNNKFVTLAKKANSFSFKDPRAILFCKYLFKPQTK